MEEKKIESMLCPITQRVMVDPVKASDGQTYERKAIQDVIDRGDLSPVTGQPLMPELKPDTELQKAIVEKVRLELIEAKQENPQIAEQLQIVANNLSEGSSLEQIPGEILTLIGDYAGLSGKKRLAESGGKELLRFFKDEIKPANAEFIAFLDPILRLNPNEVKVSLEARPDIVPAEEVELTKLLIHVVKGEITEAEAMLTANPALLLTKGRVIDFSGRSFLGKGITAFQYALAAQDMPMTKILLKHSLKSEEAKRAVAEQYEGLGEMLADKDENKYRALKNLNNSINDLHKKLGGYIEKYGKMTDDEFEEHEEEAKRDWSKVVGGAQRKLPAWVILMICEERDDNKGAWVLKNIDIPVERNSEHLRWWLDPDSNGLQLGTSWAVSRGVDEVLLWYCLGGGVGHDVGVEGLHDHDLLALCQSARPGELPTLESLYSSDVLPPISIQSGQRRK